MRRLAASAPVAALCLGLLALTAFVERHTGPPQARPGYPFGDAGRWLPHVRSLRIRAAVRFETGPDAIARSLGEIRGRFPDLRDPDPLAFTGLLPVVCDAEEWAFDRSRLRYSSSRRTEDGRELLGDLRVWDGKRAVMRWRSIGSKQDGFRLAAKPDRVAGATSSVTYLSRQPPACWWNDTQEANKEFEQSFGTPADYVLVGRESYHGVECHVLLSAVGNQSDRYYVGVNDGRWYGAREGIIAIPQDLSHADQLAVEEFLGKRIGDRASDAVWARVRDELGSLPPDRKAAWCRLNYSRVARHYVPAFEYWFTDFRDVGGGRTFPFREEMVLHGHEGQEKTFVETKRTVTIEELTLDRPLGDHLFQETPTEGALVIDERHKPTLRYKHKAHFSADEWRAIVEKGADEAADGAARRHAAERLIGRPAPPLPSDGWLNSPPLTWADLRDRVVVLEFWAVGCAPCYKDLSALRGPDAGGTRPPIVIIGVHAPGSSREQVEKVVAKYELGAPIVIDGKGRFFDACGVTAMPTSVAVDEVGRVLAHGSLSEAIGAAQRRRAKISVKE